MSVAYTVALCTHDHADRLVRTLADLRELHLPEAAWELLIVDNAADSPQRVALIGHAYPFRAMYTLDGYGGLHPANEVSPVMPGVASSLRIGPGAKLPCANRHCTSGVALSPSTLAETATSEAA